MRFNIFVKSTLNITTMNSKRKDLQYASVFLLAVALTFLMGKGDNLWLVSWGDLIPSLFVLAYIPQHDQYWHGDQHPPHPAPPAGITTRKLLVKFFQSGK